MASITIRNLDENLKARLRVRAAHHGRSMEDESRDILRTALAAERRTSRILVQSIRRRFTEIGGIELNIPSREPIRKPPNDYPRHQCPFGTNEDQTVGSCQYLGCRATVNVTL